MDVRTTVGPLEASIQPDPHGRAALILIESLIHGLTARGVLSVTDAVEFIEVALDAQRAVIDDVAQPDASMDGAALLLEEILSSMRIDLPSEGR